MNRSNPFCLHLFRPLSLPPLSDPLRPSAQTHHSTRVAEKWGTVACGFVCFFAKFLSRLLSPTGSVVKRPRWTPGIRPGSGNRSIKILTVVSTRAHTRDLSCSSLFPPEDLSSRIPNKNRILNDRNVSERSYILLEMFRHIVPQTSQCVCNLPR